ELAEALLDVAGLAGQGRVLFVNSGAEANEAALKISRLTGRTKVVACEGAFHGRTMGSLSLTGQPGKRQAFEPLVPGVVHVPFGAVIGAGEAGDLFKPGQHGTTFGGNPVCCAAGLAVLRAISRDGLLDHVSRVGKDLAARVEELAHPLVKGVRGAGLLIGLLL